MLAVIYQRSEAQSTVVFFTGWFASHNNSQYNYHRHPEDICLILVLFASNLYCTVCSNVAKVLQMQKVCWKVKLKIHPNRFAAELLPRLRRTVSGILQTVFGVYLLLGYESCFTVGDGKGCPCTYYVDASASLFCLLVRADRKCDVDSAQTVNTLCKGWLMMWMFYFLAALCFEQTSVCKRLSSGVF